MWEVLYYGARHEDSSIQKRCAGAAPDVHQRTVVVAAAAGDSLEDHDWGQLHTVVNTQGVLSGEASSPPFERLDGPKVKVKFPPAANKLTWKQIDSKLSQALAEGLLNRSLS